MDKASQVILVTGATGTQGGAVARKLLAEGWRVRALTRDPAKPSARALTALGVELVRGDMDDPASLTGAMKGVHGVFSVQAAAGSDLPPGFVWQDEARWGVNVAEAAAEVGVETFVYTSANGADTPRGLSILEPKARIERRIAELGLPATVVRPTTFMENFVHPLVGLQGGKFTTGLKPDIGQQFIAADDIAVFVVLVFARPDEFRGRSFEIAGDELTPPETAELLSRRTGRTIEYVQVPDEALRARSEEVADGFEWMNQRKMAQADIPALRRLHPGLLDLETWLDQGGVERITAHLDGRTPVA
ncbi:NmrA/HSCARG family protein [Streptomyces mayteni]